MLVYNLLFRINVGEGGVREITNGEKSDEIQREEVCTFQNFKHIIMKKSLWHCYKPFLNTIFKIIMIKPKNIGRLISLDTLCPNKCRRK